MRLRRTLLHREEVWTTDRSFAPSVRAETHGSVLQKSTTAGRADVKYLPNFTRMRMRPRMLSADESIYM